MKVVEFPHASLTDIPKQLRNCADRIEAGDYGAVQFVTAIVMNEPPLQAINVFLWGRANELEMLGAFSVAHHQVLANDLEISEEEPA